MLKADEVGASGAALAKELRPSFSGEVLIPGDEGFEAARTIWNAMIDKRPGLIARCACTDDVVAAVRLARKHDLVVSVRGGGHGVSGKSLCEGGLTIDLRRMRRVSVDPDRQLVRVGGGCLLGDIDEATAQHGLVVPVGIISETGIGGLALGGGIGWFSRKHGMTCDNFESLELVTAAGETIRTTSTEHPDLFWGLHGGGGNFGVVTEFEFRAHVIVTSGALAAETVPLDMLSLYSKSQSVIGIRTHTQASLDGFWRLAQDGIEARVDKAFPLEMVVDAHQYVEAERNFGRVLLTVHGESRRPDQP